MPPHRRLARGARVMSRDVAVGGRRFVVFVARLAGGRRRERLPAVHPAGARGRRWRGSSRPGRTGPIGPHLPPRSSRSRSASRSGPGSALVVGYALARSALVERLLSPYLVAAQAMPILALAPLLALWFGPGLAGKVVICALIVFFPVAIATMVGIRAVDARLLELGRCLRATRARS